MASRVNLKSLSFDELDRFVLSLGWARYRSSQVLAWIYQHDIQSIDSMTNLSKADRMRLAEAADLPARDLARRQQSEDGTEKFLFRLGDGRLIEAVLIPDNDRRTLCLSTQVGCTLDCTFCLTGTMGLERNLAAEEITDQVMGVRSAQEGDRPLTNYVFMGMGEPLANYRALAESIRRMTSPRGMAISPRRITVSTSGLVPQIDRLGQENLGVNLAVSLNAATDDLRDEIMPLANKTYPLRELMAACRRYPLAPRRRLTFEYVLLSGVNDRPEEARQLARLVRGIACKINLIPFNAYPGSPFQRPADDEVFGFQRILTDAGIDAFIRKSRGRDILAACGQLKTAAEAEANRVS